MTTALPPGVGHFDNARPLPGSAPMGGVHALPPGEAVSFRPGVPADDAAVPLPPLEDAGDREILASCVTLEHNDTDNGRRLLMHFGPDVLHVREVGWHRWTGKVWARQGGEEAITAYAQRTAKRIHGEAGLIEHTPDELRSIRAAEMLVLADPKKPTRDEDAILDEADEAKAALKGRRRAIHQHAKNSGNDSRINAMVKQALPHRSCGPTDLDADHMLFNCENATLQFSRVVDPESEGNQYERFMLQVDRLEHTRAHRITKVAPVTYDPKAECPKFRAFISKFQPDVEVARYIQSYLGLSLTGHTSQQCFQYWFGRGANGKSTLSEAVAGVFGPYSDLLNAESLTGSSQRRGDQATPDFAELPGVRFLRIAELPRGEPLREALIKALTGGEEIKARHLNKGFFKYQPVFKAVMSGNDLPAIGGLDHGIWRRVKLVKWPVMITDEERRPMDEVLAEFAAERSGILNWLIAGLDAFMRNGLVEPIAVTSATRDYREDMDPVGAFAADCIAPAEDGYVTAREVYNAFVAWCEVNVIRVWKEKTFALAMEHKGFAKEKTRIRRYPKIRLHDVPERPLPDPRGPRSPIGEDDDRR